LAGAAERVLTSVPNVRVIHGDWREILQHGPFAFLFVDAAAPKQHESETLLEALRPGGVIVLDDLTPGRQNDPMREFWLTDPRVVATEVLVSATEAVILATRADRDGATVPTGDVAARAGREGIHSKDEAPHDVRRRLHEMFAGVEGSMAEELIAERRAEARRGD